MIRMALFDIDGTLYEHRCPVEIQVRDGLLELERRGVQVALISGRSHDYVYGFAQALGLTAPALLGENGFQVTDLRAGLQNALLFPRPACLRRIFQELEERFPGGLNLQPDRVSISIRPTQEQLPELLRIIERDLDPSEADFLNKPHFLYLCPKGADKGVCAQKYCALKGVSPAEVIAAGDSENDLPLLKAAGRMIAVGSGIPASVPGLFRAASPTEMIRLVLKWVASCTN